VYDWLKKACMPKTRWIHSFLLTETPTHRSRPGVSPLPARINSCFRRCGSRTAFTTSRTLVRSTWCRSAVVSILLVWQIFPGTVLWTNVVECCYTVLSSSRIGSWAVAVYIIHCRSLTCRQRASCNDPHVHQWYAVISVLWSQQYGINHRQITALYHGH